MKWKCFIIVDWIIMANGIITLLDFKTIYVAVSLEKRIRVSITETVTGQLFLPCPALPCPDDDS